MSFDHEQIKAEIEKWRVATERLHRQREEIVVALERANTFYASWQHALESLDTRILDLTEGSQSQFSAANLANGASEAGPTEAPEMWPDWMAMALVIYQEGGQAPTKLVRDRLLAMGRLSNKHNVAYNQVYTNSKRKPEQFRRIPGGIIELLDMQTNWTEAAKKNLAV